MKIFISFFSSSILNTRHKNLFFLVNWLLRYIAFHISSANCFSNLINFSSVWHIRLWQILLSIHPNPVSISFASPTVHPKIRPVKSTNSSVSLEIQAQDSQEAWLPRYRHHPFLLPVYFFSLLRMRVQCWICSVHTTCDHERSRRGWDNMLRMAEKKE